MATKKTKTLKDVTTVTTVNNDQYIPLADASGKVTKITLANLKASILGGMSLDAITDGVGVAYYVNTLLYAARTEEWKSLQGGEKISVGILLIDGGKALLLVLNNVSIPWSSSIAVSGGVSVRTLENALNDFNGKANTEKLVEHPEYNTIEYAPGFCNLYTVEGAEKNLAGKWWLPSIGEMMMIIANLDKINYALSLVNGAKQISTDGIFFTSSEYSIKEVWTVTINSSLIILKPKNSTYGVIPVTSFSI